MATRLPAADRPHALDDRRGGGAGRANRFDLEALPTAPHVGESRAMNRADAWRDKGNYFSWSPRSRDASEVQVFHVELGDAGAPPLVLVHGFPTSSIDWF